MRDVGARHHQNNTTLWVRRMDFGNTAVAFSQPEACAIGTTDTDVLEDPVRRSLGTNEAAPKKKATAAEASGPFRFDTEMSKNEELCESYQVKGVQIARSSLVHARCPRLLQASARRRSTTSWQKSFAACAGLGGGSPSGQLLLRVLAGGRLPDVVGRGQL